LSGYWNGGAGCSIETLAELIGDTPKVAFDHYGREWGQHYQEPLWLAVGAAPTKENGSTASQRLTATGGKRAADRGSRYDSSKKSGQVISSRRPGETVTSKTNLHAEVQTRGK
jgi:hypothetical protein